MLSFTRRDFIKLLGISTLAPSVLTSCAGTSYSSSSITSLSPTDRDELLTAKGLSWKRLISEQEAIGENLLFGTNNDYLQLFPLSDSRAILWVNHEYIYPLLSSKPERTKDNVLFEMSMVGGSLLEISKESGDWEIVKNSSYNRRITAQTKIPFAAGKVIKGSNIATGTLANCAGGKTPWGTVLTCEENYDGFFGETDFKTQKHIPSEWLQWDKFFPYPPEHYGWVVEVNPLSGAALKHTSMGRFAHECATVRLASKNIPVVYSGDDTDNEHLYKFISHEAGSLTSGTLFVAQLETGKWIPLTLADSRLKTVFKDELDLLINARQAAKLVGATPLDRPEDIEVDPFTGAVLVALTNNKTEGRPFGKILKLKETNNDPLSQSFEHEVFLSGGSEAGLACPDNLAFDRAGNLWITTDISGSVMNQGVFKGFKNNGLFVVPRSGPQAGLALQVASAPRDAEFTGPLFSQDFKTLFLSVQHPGELTRDLANPTSRWPFGEGLPKSSVITIQGPLLEQLMSLK